MRGAAPGAGDGMAYPPPPPWARPPAATASHARGAAGGRRANPAGDEGALRAGEGAGAPRTREAAPQACAFLPGQSAERRRESRRASGGRRLSGVVCLRPSSLAALGPAGRRRPALFAARARRRALAPPRPTPATRLGFGQNCNFETVTLHVLAPLGHPPRAAPAKAPSCSNTRGLTRRQTGLMSESSPRSKSESSPRSKSESSPRSVSELFGITSKTLVRSGPSASGPAGGASDGYGLGRGAAGSDRRCTTTAAGAALRRIHPHVRSCSATGTDRDRSDLRT